MKTKTLRLTKTYTLQFCCNRCYGIFRQVGAHVARAKCVGLDSFPEEEVKRLEALGNAGAKDFWEANLTSTAWTKPTEQSSNEEVRRWIVAKYERASFIPSGENKPSMPPLTDRTRQSHSPGAPLQTPFPVATPETNSSDVVSLIDL